MSLVSIIMPYYKKETFVKGSIVSLLNQTYQNFEILMRMEKSLAQENQKKWLIFKD